MHGWSAPVEKMATNPKSIDVIMCCVPRDLAVARIAVDGVKKYVSSGRISVATRSDAFAESRNVLGNDVELLDERELTGDMSLEQLQKLNIEGFPARAGWYLQQMAKLGYAMRGPADEYYLIWDCDTVPLREMVLFEPDGRPLYTMSDEHHAPYWETYERLFGFKPDYFGSFISQHMVVNKAIARQMLAEIQMRHPGEMSWSWAIMKNLALSKSLSLFSEYETYGYYLSTRYPREFKTRRLPWTRSGALYARNPTSHDLTDLAAKYYFAAFESWQAEGTKARAGKNSVLQKILGVGRRLRQSERLPV